LAERQRLLTDCVGQLRHEDRDLVERRYMQGATPQSVAQQVGRSLDAVYKALARIRRALADCVQRKLEEGRP
jgi:RNA polymerase sigma-70 factor (ECF subfamily)